MADASSNDQLLQALKKFPGNLAGGPVDVSNLLLGLATGKGLSGFSKEPIGGSDWINRKFGLGDSKGTVEDIATMISSLATPGGAAKAMIVPAAAVKSFQEFNAANKAAKTLTADELWARHATFKVPLDDVLRAVISDEKATLKPGSIVKREGSEIGLEKGPQVRYKIPWDKSAKLPDVLEHPELYKAVPELKNVTVRNEFGGFQSASYDPVSDTIRTGMDVSEKNFISNLLHEVQHAIQAKSGMTPGSSPKSFVEDSKTFSTALTVAKDMQTEAKARLKAIPAGQDTTAAKKAADYMDEVVNKLSAIDAKAWETYKKSGGESEARATQKMFETRADPSANPISFYEYFNELVDPRTVKPLDSDPIIKAIVDHLTNKKPPTP